MLLQKGASIQKAHRADLCVLRYQLVDRGRYTIAKQYCKNRTCASLESNTGFIDKMDLLAMLFHLSPVWPVNEQIVHRICHRFLQNEVRLAPNGSIFVKSKP